MFSNDFLGVPDWHGIAGKRPHFGAQFKMDLVQGTNEKGQIILASVRDVERETEYR